MATFKLDNITYVDAILFTGDNVIDVIQFMTGEREPLFTLLEGSIEGQEVSSLVCFYEDSKGVEKRLDIGNGYYCIAAKNGYKVMDQEKFESKYELV